MNDTLGLFGQDPWWIVVIKVLGIFVLLVLLTLFTIWWERRVVARMQNRVGPNRVGPFGLLQSLMDGIKLALKEEIIPRTAHRAVYWLAPVISATMAFIAFAVIPFGPEVSMFGVTTPLQLTDFPVSVLYVLAIASRVGPPDLPIRCSAGFDPRPR
jgi:NADH-quinone oxidoreductase subunit H